MNDDSSKKTIKLTHDQETAFIEIKDFLKGDEVIHTLVGFAGAGKTFLTKYIFWWAQENNISVAGLAPTHKARKVLEKTLNTASFLPAVTMTVAKFLNKMKQHSYVGAKNFKGTGKSYAPLYDLFLIDECSMISDKDVDEIVKHIIQNKKKALFIGDRAQIPNPVQRFEKNKDGTISKKDSKSFDFPTSTLTTIVRQGEDSPLLEIYTRIRKDLFKDPKIERENYVVDGKGVKFYTKGDRFKKKIKRDIEKVKDRPENMLEYKVVTYTNDSVRDYNKYIRGLLGYEGKFVVNDLLMGYNNVGFPIPIIENGQEYFVRTIDVVHSYLVKFYRDSFNCAGHVLSLEIAETNMVVKIFVPNIISPQNRNLLMKLKELANKVNQKGSTKEDFKRYSHLKNQVIFMENVYEYEGRVVSESQLKDNHPKLFNGVNYYIDSNEGKLSLKDHKSVDKMKDRYPGLLEYRVSDSKPVSDSERLVDRYQLIDKDIDYGYALTCHKAQGSTYHTVYIDETNFNKICNRWNPVYDAEENGTKERNQLKYVAYTRPTHIAAVLHLGDD